MFREASLTVTITSAYPDTIPNYTVGMAKSGWEGQLLGLASVRRYLKLPLCMKGPVTAACRMALPSPSEPLRDCRCKLGKIVQRNNSAHPRASEEERAGDAPCARTEIPLQPEPMGRQLCSCRPMVEH